ncbi:MAG: NAD-dependent epimerase/dehydratase family protein [Bacteroidales bacterium]|nr:NAD-dependent epimerase/dehydratase family protein [Bacteroidales bacterium]MBD5208439.1 NAD-dependent epimerase/dehydratase family protein [Bacteroidales bacterium]
MKILVTGAAGFIGFHLVSRLCGEGETVVGIDNINDYYPVSLKYARLEETGIPEREIVQGRMVQSKKFDNYKFCRVDICDKAKVDRLFEEEKFDIVVNLAAQAGVRYSIENPYAYIESNIVGFLNILEASRLNKVRHLVYASSSSVYGGNTKTPFSETDRVDNQVSVYAATKKSNELMANVYSKLYGLPTTGLRFFTVYGPWGRPDMSPFLFMDAIFNDRPIKVFNNGDMLRDFTFIDDIIEGVRRIIDVIPDKEVPSAIYNIGNQSPTRLMDYIECIERAAGRQAKKEYLPMQPGDVYQTYADSSALSQATGFAPATPLQDGINRTAEWFRSYFKV